MTTNRLAEALGSRLGARFHIAWETVGDVRGLHDREKDSIARAVHKRQAEFAAGRRAARAALAQIGFENIAIPSGRDRAPLWPTGVVGSITHDQGLALAIVARTREVGAVGIDVTEAAPLPGGTRKAILKSAEEQGFGDLEARAAFAIKETLFKALHPKVQCFFGFDAALARPDLQADSFSVELLVDLPPYSKGAIFNGVLVCLDGCIATALAVPN